MGLLYLTDYLLSRQGNSLQYFPRSWFTGYMHRKVLLDYYIEIFPR